MGEEEEEEWERKAKMLKEMKQECSIADAHCYMWGSRYHTLGLLQSCR